MYSGGISIVAIVPPAVPAMTMFLMRMRVLMRVMSLLVD
jgi:hypothetical protein